MEWLNYHHLLYFWTAVREGGVSKAAAKLRLAQPTVSGQLRTFEEHLGHPLFVRERAGLRLTDVGKVVYRYADEIFSLGRELQDSLKGRPTGRPVIFRVGVVDVVPKLVAFRLLEVAVRMKERPLLHIEEDSVERLLARLGLHELDLVISDAPADQSLSLKVYNHLLGECGVGLFAARSRAQAWGKDIPKSLDGAPFIMPRIGTTMRRGLESWFEQASVRPDVVAEIEDGALVKVFGQAGLGVFAAPECIEGEVERQFDVKKIARVPDVTERFYGISGERRIKHPAVVAIAEAAKRALFI